MKRRGLIAGIILFLGFNWFLSYPEVLLAQQRLKFSNSARYSLVQSLPIVTALEKGFWKENGLEVEFVPFLTGGAMGQAMAAGHVSMGVGTTYFAIQMAARGLPVEMVSLVNEKQEWVIWVLAISSVKGPEDLKGKKIGISRIGAAAHAITLAGLKAMGIEKEVKVVAVGGVAERLAAIKTGAIEAFPQTVEAVAPLVLRGELRRLITVTDLLPKPWIEHVIIARKDFVKSDPLVTGKAVRGMIQAQRFIKDNPQWAVERIKGLGRLTDKEAQLVHQGMWYSRDGVLDGAAIQNVREFLLEYGIIRPKEAPKVEEVFTNQFTG